LTNIENTRPYLGHVKYNHNQIFIIRQNRYFY